MNIIDSALLERGYLNRSRGKALKSAVEAMSDKNRLCLIAYNDDTKTFGVFSMDSKRSRELNKAVKEWFAEWRSLLERRRDFIRRDRKNGGSHV